MKKRLFGLNVIILFILSYNAFGQDFYDVGNVNIIEINFAEDNWDAILKGYQNARDEERLIGTAVINGVKYESVGVKYKGNSSYSANRIKNPLNIKLDHVIDGQNYQGYGTLKLSNGFMDPSFAREVLGYEIARKYTPAGKANFINVYINGQLIGLYTSVQSVDKLFLDTFFYSDDNTFIKADTPDGEDNQNPQIIPGGALPGDGGDENPGGGGGQQPGGGGGQQPGGGQGGKNMGAATLQYLGSDISAYYSSYDIRSDNGDVDWENLVKLCIILNNDTANIETILNVDRALWHIAYHNLLVSLDSAISAPHNYYLYMDDKGLFNYIFWDLNMTFGTFTANIGGGNQGGGGQPGGEQPGGGGTTTNMAELDPLYNIDNTTYPIVSKLLPIAEYQKIYIAHMKTIMEENFSNGWYKTRIKEIQSIIDPYVQADPNKFYTYNDFLNSVDGLPSSNVIGIGALMEARIAFLNSHSLFQAQAPTIAGISDPPADVSANSDVLFTAQVSNANKVKFCYRQSVMGNFEKAEMLDDGKHNDGNANDGIYGALIHVSFGDIQYYIYAENDQSGMFSPEHAEYEYYTFAVTGSSSSSDIVINEFMADNETTAMDQDGENDDWIELYNNSDNEVSLNGYYLTDDSLDLKKWAFPEDTTISAKDYLIVWADGDEAQQGLHTSFGLSASGEELLLVNPDGLIIDKVVFNEQAPDVSMGRYPDGIGSFIAMSPSFSAKNRVGDEGISQFALHQNYPNPFSQDTTISYDLPTDVEVMLTIYNIQGQRIRILIDEPQFSGTHEVVWDGTNSHGENVSSGVYFYALQIAGKVNIKKMVLIR